MCFIFWVLSYLLLVGQLSAAVPKYRAVKWYSDNNNFKSALKNFNLGLSKIPTTLVSIY